jgi:hypothetical protein
MKLKLRKFLTRSTLMAINLQLIIAPNLAIAQQNETLGKVIGTTLQVGQAALGIMQQAQMQQQMMQMQSSMGNLMVQPLSPMEVNPLYAQFGCMVLPAKTSQINDDMKCDPQSYDPSQLPMYGALQNIAEQNRNVYDNFTTQGNSNFSQGAGCYENATTQFEGMLKTRLAMIDELSNSIDRKVETFAKMAERDLDNIKRGQALIDGKDPEGKYLKDVKFEDKFNDKQCASFMNSSTFKSTGSSKGFQGIRDSLFAANNSPKSGMSPDEFNGKFLNIQKDIRSLGEQINKEITSGDFGSTDLSQLNLSSKFQIESLPAFNSIIKRSSADKAQKIQDWQKEFGRMGADQKAQQMLSGILSESTNLENEIANYERTEKNGCVNRLMQSNFSGAGGFTSRLSDPNISSKANREADSAFKNFVETVLSDDEYTIEEKIAKIRAEEANGGNDRYTLVTGKSMTIKGQKLGASARLRASDVVGLFVDNCKEQFESTPNGQGKSKREILNSLASINSQYNTYKKTFASKVQGDLVKEMLDCPQDTSTGSAANSCGGALDMKSPSFCLRTASTCAANMKGCLDKAEKMLETTKAEQKVVAARYKQNMDRFKLGLTQAFAQTDQLMKAKARELDAMMRGGTLYSTPTGLKLDLTTSQLMKGVDPALQIEDPKAYQKIMQENLAKIKTNVQKQNSELASAAKKEKDKYLSNYKQQQAEWTKIAASCKALVDRFYQDQAKQTAEQNEKIAEQNEKVADMCSRVDVFSQNPMSACDNEPGDLAEAVLEASSMAGDRNAAGQLKELQSICDSVNNESSNPFLDSFGSKKDQKFSMGIEEFCKKVGNKDASFKDDCATIVQNKATGDKCDASFIEKNKKKLCVWNESDKGSDIRISLSTDGCKTSSAALDKAQAEQTKAQEAHTNANTLKGLAEKYIAAQKAAAAAKGDEAKAAEAAEAEEAKAAYVKAKAQVPEDAKAAIEAWVKAATAKPAAEAPAKNPPEAVTTAITALKEASTKAQAAVEDATPPKIPENKHAEVYKLLNSRPNADDCIEEKDLMTNVQEARKRLQTATAQYVQARKLKDMGQVEVPSCNSMSFGQIGKQMMAPAGSAQDPLMQNLLQGTRQ